MNVCIIWERHTCIMTHNMQSYIQHCTDKNIYKCTHWSPHSIGGQRTILWSWFSHSTFMYLWGSNSCCQAVDLSTEPVLCWPAPSLHALLTPAPCVFSDDLQRLHLHVSSMNLTSKQGRDGTMFHDCSMTFKC